MIETTPPTPFFLADDRALDFLNSTASPWGSQIEWLSNGHDLLDWLEQAGLMPPEVLTRFRNEADMQVCDAIAIKARELREWFRGFVSTHAGHPLNSSMLTELDTLNHLLAKDTIFHQIKDWDLTEGDDIGKKKMSLRWQKNRHWQSPDALLLPIAEAMGELICRNDFDHVKNCEGPKCTMWFHDISQNRTRRWCSMAVCGNRAKAAAHRAKKKSARIEANSKNKNS